MARLEVRKLGDSFGLVLPAELAPSWHGVERDSVILSKTADGSFLLTSGDPGFGDALEAAQEFMGRYRTALGALAR